jgi:hypothetical protein
MDEAFIIPVVVGRKLERPGAVVVVVVVGKRWNEKKLERNVPQQQ